MIIVIFQQVRGEYGMHTAFMQPIQLLATGGRMELRGALYS